MCREIILVVTEGFDGNCSTCQLSWLTEATIKGKTKGDERVLFVMGTETFYRKLICASLTQGPAACFVILLRVFYSQLFFCCSFIDDACSADAIRIDAPTST